MLIFANPSTPSPRPARRRTKKKGSPMATKKRKTRRRVSARKVHRNPAPAKRRRRSYKMHSAPKRRRRTTRNPGAFSARGILGELASMNGVILIGSAVVAPTVTNMAVSYLPENFRTGYTGLMAKAVIVGIGAYALDRFVKSRHAALGFAIGGLGTVINDGINVMRVRQALPPTVTAAQEGLADELAKNPAAFRSIMDGNFNSLNGLGGYENMPVNGYEVVGLGDDYGSYN